MADDIRVNLRNVIKGYEIETGKDLTYEELHRATGISMSTISDLVNDKVRRFDAHVLARLCRFFECELGDLLVYVPDAEEG